MERTLKVIAVLLSRVLGMMSGENSGDILASAEAMVDAQTPPSEDEGVEKVYRAYPTKCPVRGTATGKCQKNKNQIRTLLKKHTPDELVWTINRYIDECTRGNVYIKNFGTFLNQLPDYSDEMPPVEVASSIPRPRPQE